MFSQSALFCLSPHLVNISKQDISTEFITQLSQPLFDPMNVCTMTRLAPFVEEEGGVFEQIGENLEIFTKKGQV